MATLNTNYTLLLNNYIGNFGGVNAYLRVYAKIERQDLINNKSYVAIKEVTTSHFFLTDIDIWPACIHNLISS